MTMADTITLEEEAVAEVVVEEAADEEAEADNGGDENAQESEEESTEAPETIATGAAPEAIARTFSAQDMDALRTAKDILETIIGDSKDAQSEKKEGLEVGFSGVLTGEQLRQVKEALSGVYNS